MINIPIRTVRSSSSPSFLSFLSFVVSLCCRLEKHGLEFRRGFLQYLAPELVRQLTVYKPLMTNLLFNQSTDIFAYGLVRVFSYYSLCCFKELEVTHVSLYMFFNFFLMKWVMIIFDIIILSLGRLVTFQPRANCFLSDTCACARVRVCVCFCHATCI